MILSLSNLVYKTLKLLQYHYLEDMHFSNLSCLTCDTKDDLSSLNSQEQMLTDQVNNVRDTIDCGVQGIIFNLVLGLLLTGELSVK